MATALSRLSVNRGTEGPARKKPDRVKYGEPTKRAYKSDCYRGVSTINSSIPGPSFRSFEVTEFICWKIHLLYHALWPLSFFTICVNFIPDFKIFNEKFK